ncbi:MAG: TIGR04211 family SH3 domain-containing protein [Deltaproteobacteria bacterium]|nr:TIGR04211 family SH3 domain-containing protein [Deltaproteobacteria bacterium]
MRFKGLLSVKRLGPILTIFFLGFVTTGECRSAKVYVTDSLSIDLYDEPSKESKVIGTLLSGEAVAVIVSDEEWSFVRPLEQEKEGLRGFVETRYLMDRIPWKKRALPIEEENQRINEKLSFLDKELRKTLGDYQELTRRMRLVRNELREIEQRYEGLKINTGDYLRLKKAYKSALSDLHTMQRTRKLLLMEHARLESSHWKRLFVSEGLLLLFGLIIGLAIGRLEKKTKSLLYY